MLGKYRLVAELARGGMGIVWLAELRGAAGFTKRCVVKELLPELAREPRMTSMFVDEARLAAQLSHRNIVQTNDVGCEDGRWFMALELLEGCTLRRLQTLLGDAIPAALAVRIVCEVLSGLEHAHELRDAGGRPLGVVHRDVTPQNVFVTFDGSVKLLDFGVAKSGGRREVTREGFAKGCIAYMSPDHVGAAPIDRRADVFAAGLVLRELLTGNRMWPDAGDREIVCNLLAGKIPSVEAQGGRALPPALRRLCEVATAPLREDRFASARHMRQALEAWLSVEDPGGSLGDLATLFDERLRPEVERVRRAHAAQPLSEGAATELGSAELVTVPELASGVREPEARPAAEPAPAPVAPLARVRRLPKRETFVAVMALVASIAAAVSVAASHDHDHGAPATVATSQE